MVKPFGKPFKYTDASDLGGDTTAPRKWYRRFRRHRTPQAWIVGGTHPYQGEAHLEEVRHQIAVAPLFDNKKVEDIIIAHGEDVRE